MSLPDAGHIRRHPEPAGVRRRTVIAFGVLLAAGGCGFRPLYAPDGAVGSLATGSLSRVAIRPIGGRAGQVLQRYLLERMNPRGRPAAPSHELTVNLSEQEFGASIQDDADATRLTLRVTAEFNLRIADSSESVLADSIDALSSFDQVLQLYTTDTNRIEARERALEQIADDITLRVALFFERQAT